MVIIDCELKKGFWAIKKLLKSKIQRRSVRKVTYYIMYIVKNITLIHKTKQEDKNMRNKYLVYYCHVCTCIIIIRKKGYK